ncbi:MAG: NUDIX hydrolase [Alphaproteobacteria bacterium]|nr:NUDIX hydrolase [Alphaproteobacteria bacterium]
MPPNKPASAPAKKKPTASKLATGKPSSLGAAQKSAASPQPKPATKGKTKRVKVAGRTVTVKEEKRVFKGFLNVDQATLIHPRFDGRRQTVTRLNLERGDSVALLLVDKKQKTVWLTEQFRYPTMRKGPGWIVELPAGGVEPGEEPVDCARREAIEETGYEPQKLEQIGSFYLSPGGSSERIILFYAQVSIAARDAELAARLQDADEDISLIQKPISEFLKEAKAGELDDAKTLIGALWLSNNRSRLRL